MMRKLSHVVTVAVLGASLAMASVARADHFLGSTYYEFSPVYHQGGIAFADGNLPMKASGLHIYERNGIGGKFVMTALVAVVMAMGRSDKEYLGSSYGTDYRVDYYRMKSAEEMAAEDAAAAETINATAENEYQMDVQIYLPQDGYTTARGFSWEITPWSYQYERFGFEVGFLLARVTDDICPTIGADGTKDMNAKVACTYSNFGSPLRLMYSVGSFATASLSWDLNWLALGDDSTTLSHASPVRALLTINPFERAFVRGGVVSSDFQVDNVGYSLEAGLRF
jgi:hypothetical protein